ncbi:dimethyladenosine transferase 2, mitochondrial [Linepithema humile]|uniref:dimethyladenosine transferase 2, mitochondrial n=1 Tax=Linepithema humile TaxID=83485 RepID=UPI000623B5D1|nr:PREDICTED: dimethyladenosine transferase 2, mitochondrial [Linepithema humile]
MIRRSFLPVITSWLSRGNKHIVNVVYSSTLVTDSSHYVHSKGTENININIKEVKKKAKWKKSISILDDEEKLEAINHVENVSVPDEISPDLKQSLMLERYKNTLYLIDREAARRYVSFIINDLSKNTSFVAELNSGFGVLTAELLKAGVPLIHVYAPNKVSYSVLDDISNAYPGRLNIKDFNILKITKLYYMDRVIGGNRVQEILKEVKNKKWEDETSMQIITATSSTEFFNHLLKSLLFRSCFMSRGRPVFYLAVPPSLWNKFVYNTSDSHRYNYRRVLFKLMFDAELLGTLDRKSFLPWPRQKKFTTKSAIERAKLDYAQIYVARIEPKIDFYSQLSEKDWLIFWYFARHHLRRRTNKVIPELEKWVPGCGIRLIAKDYTIFTQFKDLTPAQIMELFIEFKSWPEYENNYFLAFMMDSLKTNELQLLELENLKLKE